jgi:hypothetical protein
VTGAVTGTVPGNCRLDVGATVDGRREKKSRCGQPASQRRKKQEESSRVVLGVGEELT